MKDGVGDIPLPTDRSDTPQTEFVIGKAVSNKSVHASSDLQTLIQCRMAAPTAKSASQIISSARRKTPDQQKAFSGIRSLFRSRPKSSQGNKKVRAYRPTYNKVDDGPGCRIYGSVEVKKVTGNLHVTTLGHGYMSFEHTDHACKSSLIKLVSCANLAAVMNLSHIIHEFSFGPFFPAISQPLDLSYETTQNRACRLRFVIHTERVSVYHFPILLTRRADDVHRCKSTQACHIAGELTAIAANCT